MMICLPCGPSGTGGDIIPLFTEELCGHLLFCNFAMILLSSSAETLRRVLYAVNILGIMSTKSDAEIEDRDFERNAKSHAISGNKSNLYYSPIKLANKHINLENEEDIEQYNNQI